MLRRIEKTVFIIYRREYDYEARHAHHHTKTAQRIRRKTPRCQIRATALVLTGKDKGFQVICGITKNLRKR